MEIHAINRSPIKREVIEEISVVFSGTPDDLDQVISECDFVSLHLPLNDNTRQIMSARRIGLMKQDAYLINVGRGGLVDQGALFEALADGKIAGSRPGRICRGTA